MEGKIFVPVIGQLISWLVREYFNSDEPQSQLEMMGSMSTARAI